jgi:hypothetical protein
MRRGLTCYPCSTRSKITNAAPLRIDFQRLEPAKIDPRYPYPVWVCSKKKAAPELPGRGLRLRALHSPE